MGLDVPRPMDELLQRLLRKNPDERDPGSDRGFEGKQEAQNLRPKTVLGLRSWALGLRFSILTSCLLFPLLPAWA